MEEKKKGILYLDLYEYYKKLILQGSMKPGEKLPSIRRCAQERQISKTTVEAGYMQLAAEGYVHAESGSGFYVSSQAFEKMNGIRQASGKSSPSRQTLKYDFSTSTVDKDSFNFDLWRRYMKSALRNTQRLIAYGDTQGEMDLRVAIRNYVKESRGVVCSEEQIIIGAGVQSLLNILCALMDDKKSICFTGNGFKQGEAVFQDRGYSTYFQRELSGNLDFIKEEKLDLLYVSPSHMTPWGKVMPMKTRNKLLEISEREGCLLIEDDYDSEFRYYMRPMPSLQSLSGGKNVVYIGGFSRLLLPSLRIGFMVLPMEYAEAYEKKGRLYNQTASTAEQIALCQFIRDGHLRKQIKRARKLYNSKSLKLCEVIENVFGDLAEAIPGSAGFLIRMEVDSSKTAEELAEKAREAGIGIRAAEQIEGHKRPCLLLSSSSVNEEDFEKAMLLLKSAWESKQYLGNPHS